MSTSPNFVSFLYILYCFEINNISVPSVTMQILGPLFIEDSYSKLYIFSRPKILCIDNIFEKMGPL